MYAERVLSGMRPTGSMHIGHYHGALKNWVRLQHEYDCFYFVADWHALTTEYDRTAVIRESIDDMIIDWMACGIDPKKSTLFIQSHVPEHAEVLRGAATVSAQHTRAVRVVHRHDGVELARRDRLRGGVDRSMVNAVPAVGNGRGGRNTGRAGDDVTQDRIDVVATVELHFEVVGEIRPLAGARGAASREYLEPSPRWWSRDEPSRLLAPRGPRRGLRALLRPHPRDHDDERDGRLQLEQVGARERTQGDLALRVPEQSEVQDETRRQVAGILLPRGPPGLEQGLRLPDARGGDEIYMLYAA